MIIITIMFTNPYLWTGGVSMPCLKEYYSLLILQLIVS